VVSRHEWDQARRHARRAVQPIISAIPDDNPVNRAHAALHGLAQDFPWPAPYKGSVLMDCYGCGGRAWVGPELQKARTALVDDGGDPPVLCLLCAAVATRDSGRTTIIKLTGKGAGE
jgi:hypothetical protein